MRLTTCSLLAAAMLAACNQHPGANGQQPQEKPVTPAVNETYIVVKNTIMRLKPTDDAAVTHPFDDKQYISNQVGAISRGQIATVRKVIPFWSEVVLQDDAEGWIHTDALLPASSVIESAMVADATVYAGPDTNSPVLGAFNLGDLIFALDEGDAFTPVWFEGPGRGYVSTAAMSQAAQDIAMGHLLVHARWAQSLNDLEEVMESFDRARVRYSESKLLEPLADMVEFGKMRAVPKTHQSNMDPPPPRPREERL